jgi:uncharacterized protein (UPF0332 family)
MTISEEDRKSLILRRIEKTHEALSDAGFLVEDGRCSAAVNRIYYAVFHSLSAVALKHSFATSKHRQIIGWFNKEFVKTGKVSPATGELVHNAYDKRSFSDYDDFVQFTQDEVRPMLEKATAAVTEILALTSSE